MMPKGPGGLPPKYWAAMVAVKWTIVTLIVLYLVAWGIQIFSS